MLFKDLKIGDIFYYLNTRLIKTASITYVHSNAKNDNMSWYINDETEINLPLFVYGTLKRDKCNNNLTGTYIKITTLNNHIMFNLGCPVVVPKEGSKVIGELFYLEDFTLTDRLEQHPDLYKRTIVETEDGPAWCYIFQQASKELLELGGSIEWW